MGSFKEGRRFVAVAVMMAGMVLGAGAVEVNEDGRTLILEATRAFESDMRDRPAVTDRAIHGYADAIVRKLVPPGKKPPAGVQLSTTLLKSPEPELYAYTDGHIVMTLGVLYAMDNEAQLAGVLSQEVANVIEGYYISMYQEIKAAERAEARKAAASALFGALLDVAVDYAADMESIKHEEALFQGEATYGETMRKLAAVGAAQSAYYSIKDVIASIPERDKKGNRVDPRLRFEVVADAQGMEYTALAGYDPAEAAAGWRHLYGMRSAMLQERSAAMGPWAGQMRQMQSLMTLNMERMRQSLGGSGLVQTPGEIQASRADFVGSLTDLKEVRSALASHHPVKGVDAYRSFLKRALMGRAEAAMNAEQYEQAYPDFKALWEKGIRTAPVAYGMAKCQLGDFAFGASEAQKESAERAYLEAIGMDKGYAPAYKGLGELYADWDRYAEAVTAYRNYLKTAPQAKDRSRIERKIKTLERKAQR